MRKSTPNPQQEIRIAFAKYSTKKQKNYWTNFLLNKIQNELSDGIYGNDNPKEVIVEALKAFWLPIICLEDKTINEDELQIIYYQSLNKLESQIKFLKQMMEKRTKKQNTPTLETEINEEDNYENENNYNMTGML